DAKLDFIAAGLAIRVDQRGNDNRRSIDREVPARAFIHRRGVVVVQDADAAAAADASGWIFGEGIIPAIAATGVVPGVEIIGVLARSVEIQEDRLAKNRTNGKTENCNQTYVKNPSG